MVGSLRGPATGKWDGPVVEAARLCRAAERLLAESPYSQRTDSAKRAMWSGPGTRC